MNVNTNSDSQSDIALMALQNVADPEIGLNVVDLGLIYNMEFNENKINVTMTLTTQFCPMGESIIQAVKRELEIAFAGKEIILKLTFDPPWNHQMISEEGNLFLNQ